MLNILAAGVAGLLIGILVTRHLMSKEVTRAYENAKKEFEDKKAEISDKIGDQLSDMRSGLIRTLEAYVGAVSVVRENLPISQEKLSALIAPAKLRLSASGNKHSDQETSIAVEIETVKAVLEAADLPPEHTEAATTADAGVSEAGASESAEDSEIERPKVSDVSKLH